uniref:Cyclic nucleotide-binding domain-containing protein n=1 Tax=Glossina austeni TaxID=7395 RepID=A0A1A9VI12_GLOAU
MQITNNVSQVGAITVNAIQEPCDRNLRDVELISCRLRRVEPLCRLPSSALQQLAMCGFYEDLEKGVTCKFHFIYALWLLVFRAGEQGRFWYAVLGGSLEVRYHATDTDGKSTHHPNVEQFCSNLEQMPFYESSSICYLMPVIANSKGSGSQFRNTRTNGFFKNEDGFLCSPSITVFALQFTVLARTCNENKFYKVQLLWACFNMFYLTLHLILCDMTNEHETASTSKHLVWQKHIEKKTKT